MFGSEVEYKNPLSNSMRAAIVNYNMQNIELATKIQEKIILLNKIKFQINYVDSINDLFKYKEIYKGEISKGLINKKRINNIINFIPSVVVLYYQVKSGSNKEYEENNIFNQVEEIRNYSKSCYIFIIVIYPDMHDSQNRLYFNFDDKTKPNYLKNYLKKECFYMFPEEQIWKLNEFTDICNKILSYSKHFYKNLKKKYQDKRSKSTTREDKIGNDIKLGVISSIKSQKEKITESKYLEEAYEILCDKNFDLNNYKYTNHPLNIKTNFYEIRAAADWLFFKSNNFTKSLKNIPMIISKNKSSKKNVTNYRSNSTIMRINISEQIRKFERHIFIFSNNKYYENGKIDHFHFVEYYWLIQRYKFLITYIENNMSNSKIDSNNLLKLGNILFKEIYNIIRAIKFYNRHFTNNIDLLNVDINGEKINIKEIQEIDNINFGKPPNYSIIDKEDSNKKIIIGYNDEIYIKKFLLNNKINYKSMIDKYKSQYWTHLSSFFDKLKQNDKNDDNLKGIKMYIFLLKILALNNNNNEEDIFEIPEIENFYIKYIYNFPQIKKFPLIYMDFLKQYINLIQYKLKKENNSSQENDYKTKLFINLSLLGNIRKLDNEEEKIFFELLNASNFIPVNNNKDKIIINLNYYNNPIKGIIKCKDLAFSIDYSIKDIEKYQRRKLLDLIEYNIIFNSTLNKEKIKLNSLKLFFDYSKEEKNYEKEEIIKEFKKKDLENYELQLNSPVNIVHKLLIKSKGGKITLTKILFTLCKKENILYSINIPKELNKTIFISEEETDILKMKYPKKMIIAGLNQYYKFEYTVNKEPINNIKIADYKQKFQGEKMNKGNLITQLAYKNIDSEIKKRGSSLRIPFNQNQNNKSENNDDALIDFIFNNSSERKKSLHKPGENYSPPLFYYYNEEKECIEESKDIYELIYPNFESRLEEGKNKYDILIKFSNYGLFTIKLKINYFIQHQEVDENMEFIKEELFYFQIINPLALTNTLSSNNYLLFNEKKSQKKREYLTNTNINMNLIFKNLIDEGILIKDLSINLIDNQNTEIHSTIKDIIDSPDIEEEYKSQILNIIQSTNYIIPYNMKFLKSFNGCLGKFKVIWTTKSLKEFENNKNIKKFYFKNENEYELPHININNLDIKYVYDYCIKENNEIDINIKLSNNSPLNKKLGVLIENNDDNSYIISGLTKHILNLKNGEMKKIFIKLIILQKGEIKLPTVIIKEINFNGNKSLSNYFCPEKIILQ